MMYHRRQFGAWLLAASSSCAALAVGRISWWAAALLTGGVYLYIICIGSIAPKGGYTDVCLLAWGEWGGKCVQILGAAWCALMTGWSAAQAVQAFPMLAPSPAIPLVILALSYAALQSGASISARVSAVIVVFLLAFYLVIGVGGAQQIERVSFLNAQIDWRAAALLTLPLSGTLLARGEGTAAHWKLVAIAAVLVSVLGLVAVKAGSLYAAVESISLLGVMERFEGMLSAAIAAGTFSLCSLCGSGGMRQLEGAVRANRNVASALFWFAAICAIGAAKRFSAVAILMGNLLFWGLLPLLTLQVGKQKKSEKSG